MGSDPSAGRSVRGRWRYRFVVGFIWFAVLAAAAAGWRYARTSGPAYGPVIVISIESLRADHLPVYGYTKVRTPAIDALAADAVAFDRAYAHSALTLPSHVSLLSGLLPFQTGVRDEIGFPILPTVALLPQLLRRRGFKTGGMVSNYLLRKETGLGAAFGFFDDELGAGAGEGAALPAQRDGAETLNIAERWIESIGTARFFMFLHLDGPSPTGAGAERFAKYSPYDARTAYADELVGQLIAFLKKRGLYTGGILVLTSDHAEGLGDHGEQGHGLFLYEQVIRTPLIIKLPQRDGGGRHSNALVQHIDIVPTILDLMGAPRPSGLRGRSLRNLLDSPTATIPDRQVYAESFAGRYRFGWSEVSSLTDGQYRYITSPHPELYNVLQDPKERVNLVESDAKTAQQMRLALETLAGRTPFPVPSTVAEPERGRLAAMGYVTGLPVVAPEVPGDQLPDVKDRVAVANKYWQASSFSARGQTLEAIAKYREVVFDDPTLAVGWDRLVGLFVESGRFREAGEALSSLLGLYPEAARTAEADLRLQQVLGTTPTADRYVMAASVWSSLGEKTKAADVRAAARKTVGDAALRKADLSFRK
jgi:arylsulfatase A-like enzyme